MATNYSTSTGAVASCGIGGKAVPEGQVTCVSHQGVIWDGAEASGRVAERDGMARLGREVQPMLLVSYEMRFFLPQDIDSRGIKQNSIHCFIVIQKTNNIRVSRIICKFDYTLAIE